MNLFPSFATFIVVAALTYPLYEGTTAIVVSLVAGALTALFVALSKQQQVKQTAGAQQKLLEATAQSTEVITSSLKNYQEQLSKTVAELAEQTNDSLMQVWEKTQQQLLAENKTMHHTTTQLVEELAALQQQQQQLADTTAANLQQWLEKQQHVAEQTFTSVQKSHTALLQNTTEANEKMEELWRRYQDNQLTIRQDEQQAFTSMLAAVEAKEAAYSKHLQEQRDIFEAAQHQLKETLQQQAQLSHHELLASWKETAAEQLTMRQQEHAHIMDTQKSVTAMMDENTAALSDKIITSWDVTRQSLEELRKLENEHSIALLEKVEQANEKMRGTLDHQQATFNSAQSFYQDTYEQIKTYTSQLNDHETALSAQHQQLIDTQQTIKETIAKTLHDTLTKYTDVLASSKETLTASIEQLKDQRAVSEETFGEFLEAFLEGAEVQNEATKQMVAHLQTEVSTLLEDSSAQLERAITQMTRSAESQSQSLGEIMDGSKDVLVQNQQVLQSLQAQTEETKATAKLLERAFKEITTLNKNDMDILQRLMR